MCCRWYAPSRGRPATEPCTLGRMSKAAENARLLAIGLGVVPHLLFLLALLNYVVMRIIEGPPPPQGGGADIGFGFLLLAAILNVPAVICWLAYLLFRNSPASAGAA